MSECVIGNEARHQPLLLSCFASWLLCGSRTDRTSFLHRKIALQLLLDDLRVDTFHDADDAFQHHFLGRYCPAVLHFQLVRKGEKNQVGGSYAIDRRYKGDGNTSPEFARV